MNGYDKNMRKLGETSSAAETFLENKEQQARLRRLQLERDLARTASVASKMAACVEALVGGDRKVLELSVSSFASTSNELVRIFNQLSAFYQAEAKDASK